MKAFEKARTLSHENAFSSSIGLPYFSEYAIMKDEDVNNENDEMEMHIEEGFKNSILANIYRKKETKQNSWDW